MLVPNGSFSAYETCDNFNQEDIPKNSLFYIETFHWISIYTFGKKAQIQSKNNF